MGYDFSKQEVREREVKISIDTAESDNQGIVIYTDGAMAIHGYDGYIMALRPEESRLLMEALQIVHERKDDAPKNKTN